MELYLLSDVAKKLGVKAHRVVYLLTSGAVPDVQMRLGGRRLFRPEDVRRLRAFLASPIQPSEEAHAK